MKNILEYLENSAALYPEKIAFADEITTCTFQELKEKAREVGSELSRYSCQRKPVPILKGKGADTIAIMLGVVYAGGFYVILDAAHPITRLQSILDTLEADILIYDEIFEDTVDTLSFQGKILGASKLGNTKICEYEEKQLSRIRKQARDTDPLYCMFTSGSTGIPKGVVVSHRSVLDFIDVFAETFDINKTDVLGNQAPWDFDVSVKDIYTGLKTGATVQIIPKSMFSLPMRLLDFLEEKQVSTLIWAVSALCVITSMNGFSYKIPSRIRKVLFSGEVMPTKHLRLWQEAMPNTMFVNLYGPTEITCNCTYYVIDRPAEQMTAVPIGIPFANEDVFLLDEQNRLVNEAGKKGEICVCGTAVSLGYYHNEEQTRKVFVQNPLNDRYMEIIYRTGDMGYHGEDGNLYFAGRKDFQIKHMGHRIELGEIERAMDHVKEVRRCCCLYDEKKTKIVCFYQGEIEKRELYKKLTAYLPDYMIPNAFRKLPEMPLNKNGKIDRGALKELYYKR